MSLNIKKAFCVAALAVMLLVIIALAFAGCSADYIRERETPGTKNGVVTDLHKYCLQVPTDSACQGKDSK